MLFKILKVELVVLVKFYNVIKFYTSFTPPPFAGSFEIALIRLCRAFDPEKNAVAFGNCFIPIDAFHNLSKFLVSNHYFIFYVLNSFGV